MPRERCWKSARWQAPRCERALSTTRARSSGIAAGSGGTLLRHEYGRLVAILVRRVGLPHLEAVEDAVQGALLAALTAWANSIPDNPSAWLYRVAQNHLVGVLRKDQGHQRAHE